ncbi:MAG: exodeoxyribonuclease VII large subunit [Rubripirellula sp.]|nr:exodeoxyribonuclease VII large subunit [Rubripirellula sp.]
MSDAETHSVSVSELTGHIKAILEGTFPSIWVAGEVSDVVRPRSGHVYFTLKDAQSQIRGVMWRTAASRLQEPLKDGQSVLCFGDVEVYAPRGTYQLVVRKVQMQGVGGLQAAFQKLQAKLNDEGLFDAARKRPLPTFPRRIGVITSSSGAAIQDFLKAASHRWRGTEIVVIPSLVQGNEAVSKLVNAIAAAHRYRPQLDALVLARGGGSLEDLWCFNEEAVVRAVAASKIPTVSAIGHEIDVTLCDLAADVRALTPTDGATKVLPDSDSLIRSVQNLGQRLRRNASYMLTSRRERLQALGSRTILKRPHEMVLNRTRQLDDLDARARRAMFGKIKLGRAHLASSAASLSALSPLQVLTRGYSVTLTEEGQAITNASDVKNGQRIQTRLNQGSVWSIIDSQNLSE